MKFDTGIIKYFESIGSNCEFGLVQVALGIDQLGFFRFNNTSLDALFKVLKNGFKDFENPKDIMLETACNNELIVYVPGYNFRYHTFCQAGSVDEARLLEKQKTVLRFLARKCVEDLRSGEKIFVRKEDYTVPLSEVKRLHSALAEYGPNRLMWVTCGDDPSSVGKVSFLKNNLLLGYIDQFSKYENALGFSYCWFNLCRTAMRFFNVDNSLTDFSLDHPDKYRIKSLKNCPHLFNKTHLGVEIENAIIHGSKGIITVGNIVIEESLPLTMKNTTFHECEDGSEVVLPPSEYQVRIPAAYHLFGGDENYVYQKYDELTFKTFLEKLGSRVPVILLIPDREDFSVLEALRVLANPRIPRMSVPNNASVFVKRLFFPIN